MANIQSNNSSNSSNSSNLKAMNTASAVAEPIPRSLMPERWGEQVRTLGISEYKEAGLSLAQAFATDGLAQYLLDSDDMKNMSAENRWRLHVDLMTYMTAAHCYSGLVTSIGPDYEAVSLWAPPHSNQDDWLTTLRSGMWRMHFRLTAGGRHRLFGEMLPRLHDAMDEVLGARASECYYLVYLGTKPSGQRKGYARKLMEAMAAKADAEGRPMYLESSSDSNTVYYRKFGFEPKGEVTFGEEVEVEEPKVEIDESLLPEDAGSDSETESQSGSSSSSASSSDGSDDDEATPMYQDCYARKVKEKKKVAPVRLTLMIREPKPVLANNGKSIPIKLPSGFKGL